MPNIKNFDFTEQDRLDACEKFQQNVLTKLDDIERAVMVLIERLENV